MYAFMLTALLAADDRTAMPPQSIDGNWTILCLEKNGQAIPNAKNITVHVKDNIVTFKCPEGTDEKDKVRAIRLEFGRYGTIRATEANQEGRFERTDGSVPPGTATTTAVQNGSHPRTGVYVLTHDYFAVCVHDEPTTRNNPRIAPAGGTIPPNQQPGVSAPGSTEIKPNAMSHCTVILKRTDSERPNK